MAAVEESTTLASLPPEIFRQIASRLSLRALYRLRSLCRAVGPAASDLFIEHVKSLPSPAELLDLLRGERGAFRVEPPGAVCTWTSARLLRAAGVPPGSEKADAALAFFPDESIAAASRLVAGMAMDEEELAGAAARVVFAGQAPDAIGRTLPSALAGKLRVLMRRSGLSGDVLVETVARAALWSSWNAPSHLHVGLDVAAHLHRGDVNQFRRDELASGLATIHAWAGGSTTDGWTRIRFLALALEWMIQHPLGDAQEVGRSLALSGVLSLDDKVLVLDDIRAYADSPKDALELFHGALYRAGASAARTLYDAFRQRPFLLSYVIVFLLFRKGPIPLVDPLAPLGPVGPRNDPVPVAQSARSAHHFTDAVIRANAPKAKVEAFATANGLRRSPVWQDAAARHGAGNRFLEGLFR
ncbi:hypothetical protein DFJ74DRAFT_763801 [Hyaloraphidium curvatum]|nr:hypothetical protein DFJ74DRAFT_763801 [Hyaloraphidium curvatum]